MASTTRCKVLFLIKVHSVTQTLSSCKKNRIDLPKTVKVPGIRCYVERSYYPLQHQLEPHSFIIEVGIPSNANVRDDLWFDLALGQIKLGLPMR